VTHKMLRSESEVRWPRGRSLACKYLFYMRAPTNKCSESVHNSCYCCPLVQACQGMDDIPDLLPITGIIRRSFSC
jgi:hypothetical protein